MDCQLQGHLSGSLFIIQSNDAKSLYKVFTFVGGFATYN